MNDSIQKHLPRLEKKTLLGHRVLVTRARSQSSELVKRIADLGGDPIEMPMIRTVMPSDLSQIDAALQQIAHFDWIVLTSVNGAEFFFKRLSELQLDIMEQVKIAAVGPKTVQAIEAKGVQVDLVPLTFRAEDLIDQLLPMVEPGQKVLLPRSNLAREILPIALRQEGCTVVEIDLYETQLDMGDAEGVACYLEQGLLDIITFTSSSTVQNFAKVMQSIRPDVQALLSTTQLVCIGPVTAGAAIKLGLNVAAIAEPYTIEGLIQAVLKVAMQSSKKH
ncbi:uroporphyrinogen-III synthase [Thermoactinomyces sp. DSM 45892]|uniref:uroporphyrinogen-III synthase n=1 Tax=Thermoactinomyces sp. DSM 45892 TaxID=1882753 RepID=UPI00089A4507|nr:uroporphyrinogen-III synthase [Thermoactinomyces sp. DSM 45892]SDY78963.1 uroporphyrinogen III methyltransferase / synthase [Thermoactinomyces sp. DSM 45892]